MKVLPFVRVYRKSKSLSVPGSINLRSFQNVPFFGSVLFIWLERGDWEGARATGNPVGRPPSARLGAIPPSVFISLLSALKYAIGLRFTFWPRAVGVSLPMFDGGDFVKRDLGGSSPEVRFEI